LETGHHDPGRCSGNGGASWSASFYASDINQYCKLLTNIHSFIFNSQPYLHHDHLTLPVSYTYIITIFGFHYYYLAGSLHIVVAVLTTVVTIILLQAILCVIVTTNRTFASPRDYRAFRNRQPEPSALAMHQLTRRTVRDKSALSQLDLKNPRR